MAHASFLRWIIHLNVKTKLMNLLEENTAEHFHSLRLGKDFLQEQIDTNHEMKQ